MLWLQLLAPMQLCLRAAGVDGMVTMACSHTRRGLLNGTQARLSANMKGGTVKGRG